MLVQGFPRSAAIAQVAATLENNGVHYLYTEVVTGR
jgi:hypothetical protein